MNRITYLGYEWDFDNPESLRNNLRNILSQYGRETAEEIYRLGFFKYATVEDILNEGTQNAL